MQNTKSIFKSKMFWANIIGGFLAFLAFIDPELIEVNPAIIIACQSFVNIILRYITTDAVSLSGE